MKDALESVRQSLGGQYFSLSFRFTHLLGVPVDTYMKELPKEEKEVFIGICIDSLTRCHHEFPQHRLLVNSDPITFLSRVRALSDDYLYVIPGSPVHIDQDTAATDAARLKTFVDFMMISEAERVFQIIDPEMRNSGFPKRAALVGGKSYEVRRIYNP